VPGTPLTEQERQRRLRRMKQVPLALLLLMAALFAATLGRPEAWMQWAHAFAEAGMVGALADWFAVVALFRHPLGIPIPHTAIIPARKDALGEAMARFVADHFLATEVVAGKLQRVDLAGAAIGWLRSRRGRSSVQDFGTGMLRWGLDALHEQRVRAFLGRVSRRQMQAIDLAPLAGSALEWLVRDGRHQDLLTQALRHVIVALHDHRDTIRSKVREESPWWLPGFVDDRILAQMLDRIENQLYRMSLDPDHPLRGQFADWARGLAGELRTSPEYRRAGEKLKGQLLENEALQDYLYTLWREVAGRLEAALAEPESEVRTRIGQWVDGLVEELEADSAMQAWVNGWLSEAVLVVVDRNRAQIASLISETVASWDGAETARRVELAIGRDLQFIRINGTLVGGLVGLLLHALTGG